MPDASHRSRVAFALLVTVLIVSAGFSSTTFARSDGERSDRSPVPPDGIVGAIDAQSNRTNVSYGPSSRRHINPSKANENGKLSDIERWYATRLSDRIGSSSVKINKQQYGKAHSLVGSKYDRMLSQYVNVTNETQSKKDDKIAEKLNETQKNQQTYVDSVRRYRRLHERYQKANRNGNEREARRLARKLNRLQSTVKGTDTTLSSDYENVSNVSGTNLHQEARSIHRVTKNVTEQQVDIRKNEFEKSRLTVTSVEEEISYRTPLTITGQLHAENGSELANRTIRLRLTANRTVSTTTDEHGEFSISARPHAVHLGNQSFDLRYVPSAASVYLGTNETVSSTVHQTRATVFLERSSDTAAFDHRVTAGGSVRAAGRGVSNVSVALFAGGKRIASTKTTSDGTYEFSSKLPLNTSAGESRLRVQLPFHRQALTRAKATAPLRIRETPTSLTVHSNVTQGRNVSVQGRLTTANGKNVTNQTLTVLANGGKLGTVRTDTNGTYESQLTVPPNATEDGSNGVVMLATRYHNAGTNLANSDARTRVTLLSGTDSFLDRFWPPLVLGGAFVGLLLIAGLYVWRTRFENGEPESEDAVSARPETVDEEESGDDSTDSESASRLFIDQAKATLENDPNRATVLAYAGARVYLEATTSADAGLTLWEFYEACITDGVGDEDTPELETITNAYERATFTGQRVTDDVAADAVRVAGRLVDGRT